MNKKKSTRRVDVIRVNIVRCDGAVCVSTGNNDNKYYASNNSRKLKVDTLFIPDE